MVPTMGGGASLTFLVSMATASAGIGISAGLGYAIGRAAGNLAAAVDEDAGYMRDAL
jgi:hypothetical protein